MYFEFRTSNTINCGVDKLLYSVNNNVGIMLEARCEWEMRLKCSCVVYLCISSMVTIMFYLLLCKTFLSFFYIVMYGLFCTY